MQERIESILAILGALGIAWRFIEEAVRDAVLKSASQNDDAKLAKISSNFYFLLVSGILYKLTGIGGKGK